MARSAYLRDAPLSLADQAALAIASSENFFLGELNVGRGTKEVKVELEVAAAQQVKIVSYVTAIPAAYRRTTEHIRANPVDLYLVWLIDSGFLRTIQSTRQEVCHGPALTVTRSDQPFLQEAAPFNSRHFSAKIALFPGQLFRSIVSAPQGFQGRAVNTGSGLGKAIHALIDLLYDEGEHLSIGACQDLTRQCLKLLEEAAHDEPLGLSPATSIRARRESDIMAAIKGSLFERGLNPVLISDQCGISLSYLHRIFSRRGYTFSQYVERQRLKATRRWLADAEMRSHTIAQIAQMAGFSSAAQFSRVFRRTFGVTPRSVRTVAQSEEGVGTVDQLVDRT